MSSITPVCLHIPNGCPWGPPACPRCPQAPPDPHVPHGDTGGTGTCRGTLRTLVETQGDTGTCWETLGRTLNPHSEGLGCIGRHWCGEQGQIGRDWEHYRGKCGRTRIPWEGLWTIQGILGETGGDWRDAGVKRDTLGDVFGGSGTHWGEMVTRGDAGVYWEELGTLWEAH